MRHQNVIAPKKLAFLGARLDRQRWAKLETISAKLPAETHKSADGLIHKIEHAGESAD